MRYMYFLYSMMIVACASMGFVLASKGDTASQKDEYANILPSLRRAGQYWHMADVCLVVGVLLACSMAGLVALRRKRKVQHPRHVVWCVAATTLAAIAAAGPLATLLGG